jgi:hypothetical protein
MTVTIDIAAAVVGPLMNMAGAVAQIGGAALGVMVAIIGFKYIRQVVLDQADALPELDSEGFSGEIELAGPGAGSWLDEGDFPVIDDAMLDPAFENTAIDETMTVAELHGFVDTVSDAEQDELDEFELASYDRAHGV